MEEVVIVSACRVAIGRVQEDLKAARSRHPTLTARYEAVRRAGIAADGVDEIAMGQCLSTVQGSPPAGQGGIEIVLPL